MKQTNISFLILISIILVMGYFMIFNQPTPIVEPFDDSQLREEIRIQDSIANHWKQESTKWQSVAAIFGHKSDSLEHLKPSIIYYYGKKYTFNANATSSQLDSVIRASW